MKKISPKIITVAIMILSLIAAGGLGIRSVVSPNGGSIGPSDPGTGGGG
ncbi:MAG: hypothetical protein ACTSSH_02710 [Candidatus Heimdallarchaeota archaeon]